MKPTYALPDLLQHLKSQFQAPLPGWTAQEAMAPDSRRKLNDRNNHVKANHRQGCVLILLYRKADQTHFVLIKRPTYKGVHSGQIALPGGQLEAGESYWQAARRETFEEVGIPQKNITYLGPLTSLYIPPSNFMVYPFVGYTQPNPHFTPDAREVAAIIETPLSELFNPAHQQKKWMEHPRLGRVLVPYYNIFNHHVWGATAMILAEFAAMVRKSAC
jgi:8-oxo-dGTP pyrophosphatase MutT (NUDIX family)